jgi:hypothetical protein
LRRRDDGIGPAGPFYGKVPRVAYDHRQQRDTFMTPRPDDPLHTIPRFALQDGRRLAFSAGLNIVCVGGALAVGAVLLTRIMPAGGYAYFYKTLGAYLLILLPLLGFLHAHRPHTRFGPANTVTLIRAAMVCLLASLCGERWYDIRLPIVYGERWNTFELLVAAVAILALTLDGVDGWLARLRGTQSRFGARFDMETDALLVLVLSVPRLAVRAGRRLGDDRRVDAVRVHRPHTAAAVAQPAAAGKHASQDRLRPAADRADRLCGPDPAGRVACRRRGRCGRDGDGIVCHRPRLADTAAPFSVTPSAECGLLSRRARPGSAQWWLCWRSCCSTLR